MLEESRFPDRVCLHEPRLAVVIGAALYAARLIGGTDQPDVVSFEDQSLRVEICPRVADVCPLSLGIAVEGNKMEVLVPRGTTVPYRSRGLPLYRMLYNQIEADLSVYEGERLLASDNRFLGSMHVTNIPLGPPNAYACTIYLKVNENGVLELEVEIEGEVQKCELRASMISADEAGQCQLAATESAIEDAERLGEDRQKYRMIALCWNIREEMNQNAQSRRFQAQALGYLRRSLEEQLQLWDDPGPRVPTEDDVEEVRRLFIDCFGPFYGLDRCPAWLDD
jgi:molecular chaperone DnaK (HSP70)